MRSRAHTYFLIISLFSSCWIAGVPPVEGNPPASCETNAVPLELAGVPNFYRISDSFYRGAQPTREGMSNLQRMGIRTIINLRPFHSDLARIRGLPLKYAAISFKTWHSEDEDAAKFLLAVSTASNLPVFVHCMRGADRTGMMTAVYRIIFCGWSREAAIREMTAGGFGFNPVWRHIVRYVGEFDVEKMKARIRNFQR